MADPVVRRTATLSGHHAAFLLVLAAATAQAARAALIAWSGPGDDPLVPGGARRAIAMVLGLAVLLGIHAIATRVRSLRRGSWLTTGAAPFRVLFYVLVLAAVGFLLLLQPFSVHNFEVTLGLAAACFLGLMRWGPAVAKRLPPRFVRAVDLILANLCLSLLVLEGGLRVMGQFSSSPLFTQADDSVLAQLERHHLEPGQVIFGFACDDRGYNDAPPQPRGGDDRLVVAIGDSFGVGIVPHMYHYTTVAERRNPWCEIYSMGVSAVGPAAYLHLLEFEALPMEPDAVVVGIFVGNDVAETRRPRPDLALRRWFDRDNLLLWLLPRRLARLRAERNALGRAVVVQGEDSGVREESGDVHRMYSPFYFDPTLELPTFSATAFAEIERSRAQRLCGPDRGDYERLFADLLEMKRLCGEVPLLILLIPDEFQVEDGLWSAVAAGFDPPLVRDQPQRRIVPWLQRNGIPHLDLLPVLRAIAPEADGNRHLYHLRDTHLNVRGNRTAGEALAPFLLQLRPAIRIEGLQRTSESLSLRSPGIPVPLPLCVRDAGGDRHDLAVALPELRFQSSDPSLVAVTDDGHAVALRRGSVEVEAHWSDRAVRIRVDADWPAVLDLGGGTEPESGLHLELPVSPPTLGRVLGVRITGAPPGSTGNVVTMERPGTGGVRPHDPWPYVPCTPTLFPVVTDARGVATVDIPIPEDDALRGTPFFLAVVFGGYDTDARVEVSNVIAVTPE